ncbi:MAG: gliding motility-associated C-terminal domain-containing protein [Bacteroidota bacterium]
MKFLISAFLSVTSLALLAQSREVYMYEDSLTIEVLRIGCQSECTGQLGDNIFPNGDFGSGTPNILPVNPGIAPGYIYTTNPPPNDGRYTITNNTAPWGSFAGNWINIQDNGPEPNGYMMVVNASVSPGLFYEKTVSVCENTLYEFSIDVINMLESFVSGIRPNVSFLIDGVALCETGDIPNDETWRTIRFSFYTAPGQTTVKLALRNNAPGGNGNDLALDNISFRACGPDITIPGPTFDFCEGVPVSLQTVITNSPYTNGTVYQWQINNAGNWTDIPGANSPEYTDSLPADNAQYRLLVSSSSVNLSLDNCRVESQVMTLKKRPALQPLLQSVNVDCFAAGNGSANLESVTGLPPFSVLWSNADTSGQINNLTPGLYTVTLTDSKGCTGVSSVEITEPPALDVPCSVADVSCFGLNNGSALVFADGGTPPYSYLWSSGSDTSALDSLTAGVYDLTLTDANGCTQVQSLTVSQPDLLIAQPDSSSVTCFGFSNGTVQTTALGGTPPYSYLWNTGSDTSVVNNLIAGIYDVTVTDANGCSLVQSVSVSQPDLLTAVSGATNVSCFGQSNGTAQITAAGGVSPWSYLWNNGEITPFIETLPAGQYAVTLTDANGCQLVQSVTVAQPDLLAGSTTVNPVTCFGLGNGSAQVNATGGTLPYLFAWSNGGNSQAIQNLIADVYTVTLTDANGCSLIQTATVNQPNLLTAVTSSTDVTCFGFANGIAQIGMAGGTGPYNYQWSNGNSTPASQTLTAGSYTITATDANNCSLTRSFVISQPAQLLVSGTASAATCFGYNNGSVQINTAGGVLPYSFNWNNGSNSTILLNIGAGTYTVTITDNQNCTASQSYSVQQPPQLLLQQSSALHVSCYGSSDGALSATAAGGTPPYSIGWNTGVQSTGLDNLPAGTYTATATDANACTATISINLEQPPLFVLTLTSSDPVCTTADGSVTAAVTGGVPPYSYLWATGELTNEIESLEAGVYAITVTDDKNCTASGQTILQDAVLPVVSLGDDLTLDLGEQIRVTALSNMPSSRITSYAWEGAAGVQDCPDCRFLEFIPLENGCQTVVITTTEGCITEDEVCYRVNDLRRLYFPNVFSPNDDGENDFFHPFADASVKTIRFMTIYDRWGNKVYHKENFSPNDAAAGWDGLSAGREMNNAVFVWVAETEFIDGQIRLYKGDVTLIR